MVYGGAHLVGASAADDGDESLKEHQPINFGKRLAHTDKSVRDRGFRTLQKWLSKHTELERLDFMKLWKGLYFGMWMADKRPVQQDLAVNVALLLKDVPRAKQGMWIDCFWETMVAAWEQLDVHRITKYLLFIRIIVAEAFKAMRLAGWQIEEMRSLGNTFTRSMPMHAKEGPNAHSLGLLLQFTRIVWEELRPQLEQGSAPKKAILSFLEPFCILAEGSSLDSLVRHIHEYIFKRAPHELLNGLVARILSGAARPDVPKKNRQALYDTADALERIARNPLPKGVKALRLTGEDVEAKATAPLSPLPALELPPSSEALPEQASKKRKMKKRKASRTSGVSPLCLPKSALPIGGSDEAAPAAKKKGKKMKRRGHDATSGEAPLLKKKRRL